MRALFRTGLNLAVLGALLPPLEHSLGLTSGFGEYRDGRFHAGIDYSTGGRTGLPVRAVADGWVERVRTSGVGYGRSVYLRLADGRTAVYGHLSGFATALDTWVATPQDSSGEYEQDLVPPPRMFAFRRGDVLAYSGESGAGPPHLHFEIRRGDMNLHPLRQGIRVDGRRVPAEYDPEADRLTWRPRTSLAAGAHVINVDAVDALGNRSSVRLPVEVR